MVAFKPPPYRIVDLGDVSIDGRSFYHLGLDPIDNATQNVLRQMWIDKATFLPVRYVAMRSVATPADYYTYLLTVNAIEIAGQSGECSTRPGKTNTVFQPGVYPTYRFPDAEPDWVFDHTQWGSHTGSNDSHFTAETHPRRRRRNGLRVEPITQLRSERYP